MAQIKAIHHVCVETPGIDAAVAYYCDLLGFRLAGREECGFGSYAMLCKGTARVELIQSRNAGPGAARGSAPIAHIGFEVDDVEEIFAELRAKGVRFKTEQVERSAEPMGGLTACSTVGPSGEVINFYKFDRDF